MGYAFVNFFNVIFGVCISYYFECLSFVVVVLFLSCFAVLVVVDSCLWAHFGFLFVGLLGLFLCFLI